MIISDIQKAKIEGKRVLMRVDFNVEFDESASGGGKPAETYKIVAAKNTIEHILLNKAKLALISHLGRPEGWDKKFSFSNFYPALSKILGRELIFTDDCVGEKVKNALDSLAGGKVLLLENVRFYKEDVDGNKEFAGKLAENFDIFVNESFGASHRSHASIVGITDFLPSFAGFNLLKEIGELSRIRENFKRPAVALIGGAKIETKVPVIKFFAEKYDRVLAGGKIGLEARKQNIAFPSNVIVPKDYAEENLDIGPQTIKEFVEVLIKAKTIIWNGPMGLFEKPSFEKGTMAVIEAIVRNEAAFKVVGGGETVQILEKNNLISKFDFVSTGGGAMLEFLAQGTLPGIEALKDK